MESEITPLPITKAMGIGLICKFGVVQCRLTSQYGPARLEMPLRESLNHVYQLNTTNSFYQTIT